MPDTANPIVELFGVSKQFELQGQRIDALRDKMECVEDKRFSADYLDPAKRSIANAITVEFKDSSKTREVVVEYPIGHRRRRREGIPVLVEKFRTMPVHEFVDLMVT